MTRFQSLGCVVAFCLILAAAGLPGQVASSAAGEVSASHFGLRACDADSPMARRLNIRTDRGALLTRVLPDGPGAKAGLRPGDVVVRFGGAKVARYADLEAAIRPATVDMAYRVEFYRDGKLFFANVTAEKRPSPPAGGYPQTFNLGLSAVSAGSDLAHRMGIESPLGTAVTEVRAGGPAAEAGLRAGDLIVQFAGRPTDTFEDYQSVAFTCPLGSRQPVTFVRGNRRLETTITVAAGTRFDLPWYYAHGQGGYRFPVLPEWYSFPVDQPGTPPELQYDRIISIFAAYELRCYKGSWPAATADALQQFVTAEHRGDPRRQTGRGSLAGAPAAWVTMPLSGDPYLLYRIGVIHRGRRYLIDALAPVLSDPEQLPLPVVMHLNKIEFARPDRLAVRSAAAPEPRPDPSQPAPPTDDEPGAWYRHPQDLFRIPVPKGWTVMGGFRGTERDDAHDTIVDPDGRHRIICWRDSEPAPDAMAALEQYAKAKRNEISQQAGLSSTGFSINGIPMMRMTYPISGSRVVSRTAAVHRGRRVTINTVSPAGTAPDQVPAMLAELLAKTQFPEGGVAMPDAPATAATADDPPTTKPTADDTPPVPPGWVTSHVGNVALSVPPDWTTEEGMPEGHGMWRLGDGELPKVSLALVRNQPWERFSARVESPDHRNVAIAGLQGDVYEGDLAGSRPPAKLRVVVLHPKHPLDDELTWLCYAPTDAWPQFDTDLDAIFATLSVKQNHKASADPSTVTPQAQE